MWESIAAMGRSYGECGGAAIVEEHRGQGPLLRRGWGIQVGIIFCGGNQAGADGVVADVGGSCADMGFIAHGVLVECRCPDGTRSLQGRVDGAGAA